MKAFLTAWARIRQRRAEQKLARLVEETLATYEHRQFRERRAAALKGRARA
jgi:hypothetical protein